MSSCRATNAKIEHAGRTISISVTETSVTQDGMTIFESKDGAMVAKKKKMISISIDCPSGNAVMAVPFSKALQIAKTIYDTMKRVQDEEIIKAVMNT